MCIFGMDSCALYALLFHLFCVGFANGNVTQYRVTTITQEPMVMFSDSTRSSFIGFIPDLLGKIGALSNVTFAFHHVEDGLYGRKDEWGNWTGMIGDLKNKKADVAAADLTVTAERSKDVYFSHPIMDTGFVIVMKKPSGGDGWKIVKGFFSFLQPFSVDTWVAVVIAYIFASCLYGLIMHFDPVEEEGSESLLKNIRCGFPIMFYRFCFQGSLAPTSCTSRAARILLCFWSVFIIFLFALYITSLEVLLEQGDGGHLKVPITSFKELSMQTEIKYGTLDYGQTRRYFKNATDEVDRAIGKHFEQFNDHLVKSLNEGIKRVRSDENYAFIMEEFSARSIAGKSPCDLVLIRHSFIRRNYAFGCADVDICRVLNVAILQLQESGEIQALKDKWFKTECDTDLEDAYIQYVNAFENKKSESGVFFQAYSLSMDKVGSVFIFLAVGLVASGIALVGEICFAKRIEKKIKRGDNAFEAITNDMQ